MLCMKYTHTKRSEAHTIFWVGCRFCVLLSLSIFSVSLHDRVNNIIVFYVHMFKEGRAKENCCWMCIHIKIRMCKHQQWRNMKNTTILNYLWHHHTQKAMRIWEAESEREKKVLKNRKRAGAFFCFVIVVYV